MAGPMFCPNSRFASRLLTSILRTEDDEQAVTAPIVSGRLITNAHLALMYGNLGALAVYLRSLPENIDANVASRLANMIDGPKRRTGYRLKIVNHPDTPPAKRGRKAKSAEAMIYSDVSEPVAEARFRYDMDAGTAAAFAELLNGRLEALACLLRASPPRLDPIVSTQLADLIDGSRETAKYRLKVEKHPDLSPAKRGSEASVENASFGLNVAKFMADRGAYNRGGFDAAVMDAVSKFGVGRTVVTGHWRRWKVILVPRQRALNALRKAS